MAVFQNIGPWPTRALAPRTILAFLVFLILATGTAGRAIAVDQPRYSYAVSLGGYSADSFPLAEAVEISARAESSARKPFSPYASLSCILPSDTFSPTKAFIGAGFGFTLFYAAKHPFAWFSPRDTALAPALGFSAFAPFSNLLSPRFRMELSLLRFFDGRGYYAIAPLYLAMDSQAQIRGWGCSLFEFNYAIP